MEQNPLTLCRTGLLTILVVASAVTACGAGRETGAPPGPGITVHEPPYPTSGEIERLHPAINELISADAEVELLAEGFDWSEGPAWVADGDYLLFSDIPPNSIYRWSERDGIRLFLKPSGYDGSRTDLREPGSNGLAIDGNGSLILAEHGNRRIARLESLDNPTADRTTLTDRYDGARLNSPNDIVIATNGDIYFTDPPYGLAGQTDDPEKELDFQGVYLLRQSDQQTVLLAKQSRPNGIGLSPDGQTLYVANSDGAAPYIYAYDVLDNGELGARRVFFDAGALARQGRRGAPDGMTVDSDGNLWATGPGGVLIIDNSGRHLGSILTGRATANCTFDENESTLYITADDQLLRLRLRS